MFATNLINVKSLAPASLRGLLTAVAVSATASSAMADLTDTTANLVNANVQGGEWGFLLKEVDGPVLASVSPNYTFYPASTIKVVQHVHAMLEVEQANATNLLTTLQVLLSENDACDDVHFGQQFVTQALDDTLRNMMENSQNQDTNAVQEMFGRPDINDTAHDVVGMSGATQLNHKFGGDCGGPQQNANQMPLADAALLYEMVAKGEVFADDDTRDTFYDLMLNVAWFDDLVDLEAPEGMSAFQKSQFKNAVIYCRKDGNWNTAYQSVAGWVQVPAPPCSGDAPKEYTFGAFFDDIDSTTDGFGPKRVIFEMLGDIFRTALNEWQLCVACGGGGACDDAHPDPGCVDDDCCGSVCDSDPLCCTLSWDANCVALAINLCGLAPDNNDCGDAATIQAGTTPFDPSNASNDGPGHNGECGWNVEFIKDIWYEYTAICDGPTTITMCNNFDTWVGVYDTQACPVSELDMLSCNFQPAGDCNEGLTVCMTEGETYKIRIGVGNPTSDTGEIQVNCGSNGYDNDAFNEGNGVGIANTITADDFEFPCGGNPIWGTIKAFNSNGGGPVSMLDWFIFESDNSAGGSGGPGNVLASGFGQDLQITALGTNSAGAAMFEYRFDFGQALTLESGTTYWIGFSSPGMTWGASSESNGQSAQSQTAAGWMPIGSDLALTIDDGTDTNVPCIGDTDRNQSVDVDDLVNVILDWGTDGSAHGGDVNASGLVDVDDLVLVILSWGQCS